MTGHDEKNDGDKRGVPQEDKPPPKPRDGPATVFEADPMMADVFHCSDGDYFGLVLVTNWPVRWGANTTTTAAAAAATTTTTTTTTTDAEMDGPYQDFLRAVKSCFREEDLKPSSSNNQSMPAVYLYPAMHLHITLATFVPQFKLREASHQDGLRAKREEAIAMVRSASKLPEWPTEPLKLVVASAQIGKKAGILLWNDLSGGIASIRACLKQVAANHHPTKAPPIIPGIIHSTFLRFTSAPQTPGREVQEAFRSTIDGKLGTEFFGTTVAKTPLLAKASTVALVSESTPYMHIPNDDQHVLWTCDLEGAQLASEAN